MSLPYFKIYCEEMQTIMEPFSDAEKGRIFVGMMKYTSTGESPQFSGSERFVWLAIKRKIDIDAVSYVNTIEKNRINGKNGGLGKKKDVDTAENPENPVSISKPRKPSEFIKNPENPVSL